MLYIIINKSGKFENKLGYAFKCNHETDIHIDGDTSWNKLKRLIKENTFSVFFFLIKLIKNYNNLLFLWCINVLMLLSKIH